MFKGLKIPALAATLAALSIFGFTTAQAAELKIGYIDINTALENTAKYQNGMITLKAFRDKKKAELETLKKEMDSAEKDIMRKSLVTSQENLAQSQHDLKVMGKKLQRAQQDAQDELAAKKNRMDITNMQQLQKVITAYGKSHHYDMIVPRPVFIYVDAKHDLTGEITKLLDK